MTFQIQSESVEIVQGQGAYFRHRVREEAEAAASSKSLEATLIHVVLATAYAERCCNANDRAWMAANRLW